MKLKTIKVGNPEKMVCVERKVQRWSQVSKKYEWVTDWVRVYYDGTYIGSWKQPGVSK